MAVVVLNPASGTQGAEATKKRTGVASITIHGTLATCDVLDAREFTSLAIKPPAAVTAVDVYACETADGTFVLVDNVGTAGVVSITASKWNVLPAGVGALGFLKFVSTGANGIALVVGKT